MSRAYSVRGSNQSGSDGIVKSPCQPSRRCCGSERLLLNRDDRLPTDVTIHAEGQRLTKLTVGGWSDPIAAAASRALPGTTADQMSSTLGLRQGAYGSPVMQDGRGVASVTVSFGDPRSEASPWLPQMPTWCTRAPAKRVFEQMSPEAMASTGPRMPVAAGETAVSQTRITSVRGGRQLEL